jgi:CheY-like chemotaxis protein
MVKLLAGLHGGTVAVETSVGEGSCFTVWLPLRAPQDGSLTAATEVALPRTDSAPGAPIALVVEDDLKSAELIRLQLEAEGFKVLHATSAETALVLAMEQPLSLITLDIMLPEMDGWELLRRIKETPALRPVPVVIISIAADQSKGFALGAAAVMQKPISRQDLYASLVAVSLCSRPEGKALKVLVVDDDPKAAELISVRMLGLAGTVQHAYGDRDAIETARRELPDLIVLDLMMTGVDGFDVVSALHDHPDTARIPILVVTAKHISAEDRARLNGSVTAIIKKAEFDRDHFAAEVRRVMSGRKLVA